MRAEKVTVTLQIDVLSIDSVPALLYEAAEHIRSEIEHAIITKSDGDTIDWDISRKPVEF